VYTVASSNWGGSTATSSTPSVYRISVTCVQPMAPGRPARAISRHRGGPVGERPQARLQRGLHTQGVHHPGEVDAGGGALRVREEHRVGRQQRRTQRLGRRHVGSRAAARHRDAGAHAAQRRTGIRAQASVGHQRIDQAVAQHHQIARGAGQQRFLHGPHGPEARIQATPLLLLEGRLQRLHQALGGTGRQQVQRVRHGLSPPSGRPTARCAPIWRCRR
jgi:hypothetical protein